MTTIGAAWIKQREQTGEIYYSASIDKALLPLTITEEKRLSFKPNPNKGNNEKAPDLLIDLYVPDKEKQNKKENTETTINDDEVPW